MKSIYDYCKENWNWHACDRCGGTGYIPIYCNCGGIDCNCFNMPVDFKTRCDLCDRKGKLNEITISNQKLENE
jgi:hypothetical protein